MSEPRLIAEGSYAAFGGMTWPTPDGDLEWALRYGQPTRGQLLRAASILAAYSELVGCTRDKRQAVVARLRAIAAEGTNDE